MAQNIFGPAKNILGPVKGQGINGKLKKKTPRFCEHFWIDQLLTYEHSPCAV